MHLYVIYNTSSVHHMCLNTIYYLGEDETTTTTCYCSEECWEKRSSSATSLPLSEIDKPPDMNHPFLLDNALGPNTAMDLTSTIVTESYDTLETNTGR